MGVTLRRRSLAAVAILATAALGLVACSKSDDGNTGTSAEQITLNVDVFGNFGYEELYKQYQSSHPNIKIVERGTSEQVCTDPKHDYTRKLLAAVPTL